MESLKTTRKGSNPLHPRGLYHTLLTHRCRGVCAHDSCFLSVVRGFRHGLWYGMKIRFPHALVMTFLFRGGTFTDKMRDVFRATYQHSRNLALYVSLYKLTTCLMRHLRGVESPINSLVGGAVGGAIMFGSNTPVNSQINMYVMSRVIMGGAKALSRSRSRWLCMRTDRERDEFGFSFSLQLLQRKGRLAIKS